MPTKIEKEENLSDDELDERLDKMQRLPRGSFKAKPNATNLANCKVKISLYLDGDVLDYFRQRAAASNAAPYQTQINNELRRVMETNERETAKFDADILNDEAFLRALKEKLATV